MSSRTYEKSFTLGNSSAELDLGLGDLETLQIANCSVCNTDAAARSFSVNLAGDGGGAATGNALEVEKPIDGKATIGSALTGMSVNPGGKIYAFASTAAVVVIHISGIVTAQNARAW
jgi:hypothetical protein